MYSSSASESAVSWRLFADDGTETKLPLPARAGDVWHGMCPASLPGSATATGSPDTWNPQEGLWVECAWATIQPCRQKNCRSLAVLASFGAIHPSLSCSPLNGFGSLLTNWRHR